LHILEGQKTDRELFELENIALMVTHVVSGSGLAIVLKLGDGKYAHLIMKLSKFDSYSCGAGPHCKEISLLLLPSAFFRSRKYEMS
jgi:hypothetical protein